MPSVTVYYYFGNNGIERKYKNKKEFLGHIQAIEGIIITNLKKGISLVSQVEYWGDMAIDFQNRWSELTLDDELGHFWGSIVILKKLKTNMEIDYGWTIVKKRKIKPCKMCFHFTNLKCSGCHKAYYCCGECQNADWKIHKKTCCK